MGRALQGARVRPMRPRQLKLNLAALTPPPTLRLDLGAVAREQLRECGMIASNIHISELCTSCRTDLFFSHRREGPKTGRMLAVIGIRPEGEV